MRSSRSNVRTARAQNPIIVCKEMITAPIKKTEPAPIICGTDFSEAASEVSEIAAMIASALSVPLKLVFSRDWLADGAAPDAAIAIDESSLSQLKEKAHQLGRTGATVEPMMSQGPPSDALIKIATDQKAQLVIVGWHGANSRRNFESVPQLTMKNSPAPVLVIQDPKRFKAWIHKERALKIHVGADFTLSSDTALRWVKTLSMIGPCDITATNIDQPSEEEKRLGLVPSQRGEGNMIEVQETLERDLRAKVLSIFGHNEVKTLVFGNWATKSCQLIGLAEKDDADLIVVGTHQRHGVNQLKRGSISQDVLRDSPTSVACVPASAAEITVSPKIRDCKRVLVAVDLNEPHGFTAAHAYSIVDPGGSVMLFHNSVPFPPSSNQKQAAPDHIPKLKLRLRELAPEEAAQRKIVTQTLVTEEDHTAEAICSASERFNADIICIDSHTRLGFTARMLGSVALDVLQKSHRPVLVVWSPTA